MESTVGIATRTPKPSFNPEALRLEEVHDPDRDVNVEWATMILLAMGIVGVFSVVVAAAILLWLGSMVIQWP